MLGPWKELMLATIVCAGFAAVGWASLRRLFGSANLLDIVALAFPLGAGFFTFSLFVVSWMGVAMVPLTACLTWMGLLALVGFIPARRCSSHEGAICVAEPYRRPGAISRRTLLAILAALATAAVAAAWLGVGRAYSGWDDIAIWNYRALLITRQGTVRAAGISYPLNIPILIAVFQFFGDALPASKLVFPLFYLSLTVGSLRFWLLRGVKTRVAVLGSLWVATVPLFFDHATLGYANLPYTGYLVLGTGEMIHGLIGGDARHARLGGLLWGLAVWTRPEGGLAILSAIGVMALACLATRLPHCWAPRWAALPALLAGGWLILVASQSAGGQMALGLRTMGEALAAGQLHLGAFYRIARFMAGEVLNPTVWGMLAPASALLGLANWKGLRPRSNPDAFLLLVALLAVAAGVTLQFYIADFIGELMNYLGNSASRMYMPAGALAILLAILLSRRRFAEVQVLTGHQVETSQSRPV